MKAAELFEAKAPAKPAVNLQAIADELNKNKTIDEADVLKDGLEVATRKGDTVTFHLNGGKFFAWVQGQKKDIDCGDIGDSAADILLFLKGINKSWYREHDDDFDD